MEWHKRTWIIASEFAVLQERCAVFNLSFVHHVIDFYIFFFLPFLYFVYDFIINIKANFIIQSLSVINTRR